MQRYFPAAPLTGWIKLTTAIASISMLVIAALLYGMLLATRGFPPSLVPVFTALPLLVLPSSSLFVVRGYMLEGGELWVQRLCFKTRVDLSGLQQAWIDPASCRRSIRLFGNGGMFAVTGLYRNQQLGRYRLYATDTHCALVLKSVAQTVVITPARPHAVLEQLGLRFAALDHHRPDMAAPDQPVA